MTNRAVTLDDTTGQVGATAGAAIDATTAGTVSSKVLSDTFMGVEFVARKTQRDTVLPASSDLVALDVIEVGSGNALEIPSGSSLELLHYLTPSGADVVTNKTVKVTVTSATSLTMATDGSYYVFNGSTAAAWTLPPVSGNTGLAVTVENRGAAVVTISRSGTDSIYGATSGVITTYSLTAGTAVDMICDGSYWVVLTEVQPWTTKWGARNPGAHVVPNAFISYYDKPDTAYASLPAVMDTGQPITYLTNRGTTSAQVTISSGLLVLPRGVDGHVDEATYINLDAGSGNTLTRIGVKFKYLSAGSTVGSSMNLAMMNASALLGGGTAFRMGIHLSVQYNQWVLDKASNATGSLIFTQLGTGPLQNNLEWDGVTEYTCELWRVGNTAIAILPDGQRISVTDVDIGAWSTQWGYFEPYMLFGDTDVQPGATEAWYGINTQYPPGDTGLVRRDDIVNERIYARTLSSATLDSTCVINASQPNVVSVAQTIPATYSKYLADYMEIASGISCEIGAEGVLEIG
jgi:hypothetical protein